MSSSHANKRKPVGTKVQAVNTAKKIKFESPMQIALTVPRLVGESHPHFHPVGAYVQLALLVWRCAAPSTSAEVFGIEPLFRLMLDYLGSSSAWVLWYFYHEDDDKLADSDGAVISIHHTETEALHAALTEWCIFNMDAFQDNLPLPSRTEPEWGALLSFATCIEANPQYTNWRDREVVRQIISGTPDMSMDVMRDLWSECESWQEDREGEYTTKGTGRYYELKEMPFGMATDLPRVEARCRKAVKGVGGD